MQNYLIHETSVISILNIKFIVPIGICVLHLYFTCYLFNDINEQVSNNNK